MMNGLQTLPQWQTYFGRPQGALLGAMNSVYPAGKFFALFLVTWIADRFGRKRAIFIGVVTCIAFCIMQGLAKNIETFIAARAVLGFFTSFLAQPSPILITELAYPTHRGKLTALYQTSFVCQQAILCMCGQCANLSMTSTLAPSSPLGARTEPSRAALTGAGASLLCCRAPSLYSSSASSGSSLNLRDGSSSTVATAKPARSLWTTTPVAMRALPSSTLR